MNVKDLKKILIFDQGDPVAGQMLGKAAQVFGTDTVEYIVLKAHRTHDIAAEMLAKAIRDEEPELVLIGATALGEETAPALGVMFRTGVAAHCVDIRINEDDRIAFMIPAFGGRNIGEIFIPDACPSHPAVATVKPGIFPDLTEEDMNRTFADRKPRVIDADAMAEEGEVNFRRKAQGDYRLESIRPREHTAGSIKGAELILCGGYGLGRVEVWKKLETLAQRLSGAAGCTRAALDAEWGCDEESMIGTSGVTVRPKVYVGFGISGAAHHTCGITGADTIININNDNKAEIFRSSDYIGVFDAEQIIDEMLRITSE